LKNVRDQLLLTRISHNPYNNLIKIGTMFAFIVNMRHPRRIVSGAYYHVTQRFNRLELSFAEPGMKDLFIQVLKEAREKYDFQFSNLCIMDNHVHMLIKPSEKDKSTLSKIMQWIFGVFAMRYNRIKGYLGHVWHGRFRSKVVETVNYFINTFFYIASNPVRARISDHPLEYVYNGISFMKKGKHKGLFDPPDKEWGLNWRLINSFLNTFEIKKFCQIDMNYSFKRQK
jgi:putative transposase